MSDSSAQALIHTNLALCTLLFFLAVYFCSPCVHELHTEGEGRRGWSLGWGVGGGSLSTSRGPWERQHATCNISSVNHNHSTSLDIKHMWHYGTAPVLCKPHLKETLYANKMDFFLVLYVEQDTSIWSINEFSTSHEQELIWLSPAGSSILVLCLGLPALMIESNIMSGFLKIH